MKNKDKKTDALENSDILSNDLKDIIIAKRNHHQERIEFHSTEMRKLNRMLHIYNDSERSVYSTGNFLPHNSNAGLRVKISHNKVIGLTTRENVQKYNDNTGRIRWANLVLPLIKERNRLMKTEEMVDAIFPGMDEDKRLYYKMACSGALGGLRNRGKLKSYHKEMEKGDYWGTSEMFNGNAPKPEYEIK